MDDEKKQLKNLFKKLINDQNSVFYAADRINPTLLNKGRKSSYEKDKVFYRLFNTVEDENIVYENEENRFHFIPHLLNRKKTLIDLLHSTQLMDHSSFFMRILLF